VGSQLASGDGDHAGRTDAEEVLARSIEGRFVARPQHAEPGEGAQHPVAAHQVVRQEAGRGFQEVSFLGGGGHDRTGISLKGGICGSDQNRSVPGDSVDVPTVTKSECHRHPPLAFERQYQMHALAEPDGRLSARVLQQTKVVEPGPCRVHDRPARQLEGALAPLQDGAGDLTPMLAQRRDAHMVGSHGSRPYGRLDGGERQPAVVGYRLLDETTTSAGRQSAERACCKTGPAETAERPVGEQSGGRQVPRPSCLLRVKENRQRAHQVRRDTSSQQAPLPKRRADEPESPRPQVPQSTVYQLAGGARGGSPEVSGVHERHPQPGTRSLERHPRPHDAAPDHHQVEATPSQRLQRALTDLGPTYAQARLAIVREPATISATVSERRSKASSGNSG
jgi:hypothetical protein